MLMNMIRDAYREITGRATPSAPVRRIAINRPAANASNIDDSNVKITNRFETKTRYGLGGGAPGFFLSLLDSSAIVVIVAIFFTIV